MPPPTRLFVYGTLIDPACQRRVTGRTFSARPARLAGWRRVQPQRGYPYLVASDADAVEGAVLDGIDAAAWRALDAYEDAGDLYVRRAVTAVADDGETFTCEVYVGHRIPADWR